MSPLILTAIVYSTRKLTVCQRPTRGQTGWATIRVYRAEQGDETDAAGRLPEGGAQGR